MNYLSNSDFRNRIANSMFPIKIIRNQNFWMIWTFEFCYRWILWKNTKKKQCGAENFALGSKTIYFFGKMITYEQKQIYLITCLNWIRFFFSFSRKPKKIWRMSLQIYLNWNMNFRLTKKLFLYMEMVIGSTFYCNIH